MLLFTRLAINKSNTLALEVKRKPWQPRVSASTGFLLKTFSVAFRLTPCDTFCTVRYMYMCSSPGVHGCSCHVRNVFLLSSACVLYVGDEVENPSLKIRTILVQCVDVSRVHIPCVVRMLANLLWAELSKNHSRPVGNCQQFCQRCGQLKRWQLPRK